MTTIYVPRPIETAAQAAALPIGTVSMPDHPDDKPAVKITTRLWVCIWDVDDDHDATYDVAPNGHMLGSPALVPIEAEEERGTSPESLQDAINRMAARADEAARTGMLPPGRLTIQQQTRYVTPWAPASE
ncbi:hypothetical protein [Brachybacterium alimentarium]|uniref:hypothetical protein n=1 Tax=Brachybacterium alimentarium TaxID=47845 RepID=UPI000DF31D49|nr:hypothetical protein [Brachybacterium alimentarium]RCS81846.1 hypothetical protein CIK67_15730 [Brachybacterium alimentarium]